jgi:hypothetical protein
MGEYETLASERYGPEDRFFANLAYLVPGYRGYKERDLRRDEDARLRSRVLGRLNEIGRMLTSHLDVLRQLALDTAQSQLEQRLDRLDRLGHAVRFAPYGFVGFFDVAAVSEDLLERILETDLLLFQDLDETCEFARGTPFPPPTRAAFTGFFDGLDSSIERVERRLIARDKLLGSC